MPKLKVHIQIGQIEKQTDNFTPMYNCDSSGHYGSTKEGYVYRDLEGTIRNGLLEDMSSKANIRKSLLREKLGDVATQKSLPGKQNSF